MFRTRLGVALVHEIQVFDYRPERDKEIYQRLFEFGYGTAACQVFNYWHEDHPVTVTGVDDDVDDGDVAYSIVTAAATSSDSNYNGINASDVSVTNTDDDTAGITVSPNTATAYTTSSVSSG